MKFYEFMKYREDKAQLGGAVSAAEIAKTERIILERIRRLLPAHESLEAEDPATAVAGLLRAMSDYREEESKMPPLSKIAPHLKKGDVEVKSVSSFEILKWIGVIIKSLGLLWLVMAFLYFGFKISRLGDMFPFLSPIFDDYIGPAVITPVTAIGSFLAKGIAKGGVAVGNFFVWLIAEALRRSGFTDAIGQAIKAAEDAGLNVYRYMSSPLDPYSSRGVTSIPGITRGLDGEILATPTHGPLLPGASGGGSFNLPVGQDYQPNLRPDTTGMDDFFGRLKGK